jgi:hypothetical protein
MKLIKVQKAEYVQNYILRLTFSDGVVSDVDLENEIYGEVFEPLKDKEYFQAFSQDRWTVTWDCGADFAPEFLYELATK